MDAIRDLDNVYADTGIVMDPTVLQILFEKIDSTHILYGTDFPVAAMRGRRIYVMDHWVNVVIERYRGKYLSYCVFRYTCHVHGL